MDKTKGLAITSEVNDKIDDILIKHHVSTNRRNKGKEAFVNAIFKLNLWDEEKVKQAIAYAKARGTLGATATANDSLISSAFK